VYNLIGCITCFSSRRTFGLRPVKGGGGQALSVVSAPQNQCCQTRGGETSGMTSVENHWMMKQ